MAETYEIDAGRRLVTCRVWGTFTGEELVEHYRRMMADPAFDPTYSQIGDLREVTAFNVTTDEIRHAALKPVFAPGTKRAFVATSDLAFGLAKMFEAYGAIASQDVGVFRTVAEAREWLARPGAPREP